MQLSEKFKPELLRKVVTQGYSDISLSVMSDYKSEYAEKIANSRYSPQTINKLAKAMAEGILADNDFLFLMECSQYSAKNEPYVDDCLNSIGKDFSSSYASKILAAVEYEDCNYREAVEYVKSGAFYPTVYSSLSVTDDTARELAEIGVSLRGCQGFNYCYDITDIEQTIKSGDAVFVQDKDLAVKVCEKMKLPEWEDIKEEVKEFMGKDIGELTPQILENLHNNYFTENNRIALAEKVQREFDEFIADIKKQPAEEIIRAAYQIVWKENIKEFCNENDPDLTSKQFTALLSSRNTLDEVYNRWCKNEYYNAFADINDALADTANRIQASLDRDRQEKLSAPKIEQPVSPEEKQEKTVKPKKKSL